VLSQAHPDDLQLLLVQKPLLLLLHATAHAVNKLRLALQQAPPVDCSFVGTGIVAGIRQMQVSSLVTKGRSLGAAGSPPGTCTLRRGALWSSGCLTLASESIEQTGTGERSKL